MKKLACIPPNFPARNAEKTYTVFLYAYIINRNMIKKIEAKRLRTD